MNLSARGLGPHVANSHSQLISADPAFVQERTEHNSPKQGHFAPAIDSLRAKAALITTSSRETTAGREAVVEY